MEQMATKLLSKTSLECETGKACTVFSNGVAWKKHKLEPRLLGEIALISDVQITAESEELKSLSMKVKEESENAGLKLNIQKTKILASGPITSWQIDGEAMEIVRDFIFLGSKIIADGDCSYEMKRHLRFGRKL